VDPNQLIPTPDVLPAPWGMFSILLVLTFTIHLLIANLMLGGGFAAFWYSIKNKAATLPEPPDRQISLRLPIAIAFTINFGVAPLLFLQVLYGNFIYVSSVLMAVYWLSIFVIIILAYYGVYLFNFKYNVLGSAKSWMMGLVIILLLIVAFLFTNSMLLMIDPKSWTRYFQEPWGRIIHFAEPSLIPRYLHFVFASLATGGIIMGILGWWKKKQGDIETSEKYSNGLVFYSLITILQFFIGVWYLATIPQGAIAQIMFEGKIIFPFFLISIIAGLASILFGLSRLPWHTAITFVLTVFLMVLLRYAVRGFYLKSFIENNRPETAYQFSPIILFVITLLIGIAAVSYVIKLALRAQKEPVE
jgi:hypothetical protein